jgi:hypothetical protein
MACPKSAQLLLQLHLERSKSLFSTHHTFHRNPAHLVSNTIMSMATFFLVLLALGLHLAPVMAQTIPDNCLTQSKALLDCQNSTVTASRSLTSECLACQEKAFASLPTDQPCSNGLHVGAYQTCTAECYPLDYECSQLEIEYSACFITELRCPTKGDTSSGTGNGGKAAGTSGVIEACWATAFPILVTLLLGGVML